jgi:(hydroxyamino)benzene mutase
MLENDRSLRLVSAGILLFLIGLLTGLFLPVLPYPRTGLAAHMAGVLNGMFLVLLGLIWGRLTLSPRNASLAFGLLLYGTYANWGWGLVAALLGTGKLTPMTTGGRIAAPWKEALVGAGQVSLAIAMIGGCLLLFLGLRRPSQAGAGQ